MRNINLKKLNLQLCDSDLNEDIDLIQTLIEL